MNDNSKCAPLLNNMRCFLEFLSKKPGTLTPTKNLNLKWLNELSSTIKMPDHFEKYKIKNQQEWMEVDLIAVIAEIAKLTMNRKNKKIITKYGREYLQKDIKDQTGFLFDIYWNRLDWRYVFPYGPDDEEENAAHRLQENRNHVISVLFDLERTGKEKGIDFFQFAEKLRTSLSLRLINYLGEDLPERVRKCVEQVIIEKLEELGLIECLYETETKMYNDNKWEHKELKTFRLTSMGDNILIGYREVNSWDRIMPFNIQNFNMN